MLLMLSGCSTHKKIAEHSVLVDSARVLSSNINAGTTETTKKITIFDTSYLKHTIRTFAYDTITKTTYLTRESITEKSGSKNKVTDQAAKNDTLSANTIDSGRAITKAVEKSREVERRPAIWVTALSVVAGIILWSIIKWAWGKVNPFGLK